MISFVKFMNYPNPNPNSSKFFHKNGLWFHMGLGISKLFGFGFGFFYSEETYGPGPDVHIIPVRIQDFSRG